jgi:endonuclease III
MTEGKLRMTEGKLRMTEGKLRMTEGKRGWETLKILEVDAMESISKKRERTKIIFETLDPVYTHEKTALIYKTPFELLIATILSAQCTDKQVNTVTKTLFKKYREPGDFLNVPVSELEQDIRPTGFFRNKSKSITGCCRGLLDLYNGEVPGTMEELLKLPGVGRKTANVVLGAVFDIPGVVVDTHVKRLAMRLGLTENEAPDKIEADIQKLLPEERWRRFSDILIYHGREVCDAKKPRHDLCQVRELCPSGTI